jgi:Subtilase family/Thrombospondin type 3 repeat
MFALLAPASASAAEPTRIILKREPGLNARERADIRADAGVRLVDTLSLPRTEVVTAPAGKASKALRVLNADPDVVYAERDRLRTVQESAVAEPDPGMGWLWGIHNEGQVLVPDHEETAGIDDADTDADLAWERLAPGDVPVTGSGVTVAVVDSGIDADHEDLQGQVIDAVNFVDTPTTDANATDPNGHGTHVSGTIAAVRDNGIGIAGVAPDSQIMALRAVAQDGRGWDSDIADAFRYAGDHGVKIVNVSLSGAGSSRTVDAAIHAYSNTTLFVVAAGNSHRDNDTTQVWPCDSPEPNVLCVGASTNRDERADFSNYGDHTVDVFAPGDLILSTIPPGVVEDIPTEDKYAYFSGTSQAAPHVAAAAALVLQVAPNTTADDLKELLLQSADAKPAFAGYSVSGRRINADAAVAYALDGIVPPDADHDGVADAADACPAIPVSGSGNGCPPDRDFDDVPDADDNCPDNANTSQGDQDGDHVGDLCDPTPRGADVDRDGKPALDDSCPTVYGTLPNGCPYTTPTTSKPPDRDRDGFVDSADACPSEYAKTLNGCQLPALTALAAKVRKRAATVTVRTSRAATVLITIQRKRGHRWVRVTRKTLVTTGNRVSLKVKRLRKGRYRAVIVLSSSAGRTGKTTKAFRVR